MNRARSFFFVCVGSLTLAYHFGATTATARAPGNPVVCINDAGAVVTANGDLYYSGNYLNGLPYHLVSNVCAGATPAQSISIDQLKVRCAPPATDTM